MPKLNLQRREGASALQQALTTEQFTSALEPKHTLPTTKLTSSPALTEKHVQQRWEKLALSSAQDALFDPVTEQQMTAYEKNIEYFIGTV
ncbi:MAG: 3-hydroxy-3-methylglutaryl-CoA reductase, partial [Vibrio fluvialis]